MLATDIAYVAGFFDGEGTCGLALGKVVKQTDSQTYQPNVSICNTNRALLAELQKLLGLGFITTTLERRKDWKQAYKLYFPQHHLVKFVCLIQPYLRLKRRQVELVIEFCTLKADDRKLTVEMNARRAAIYTELSELNKRGC